MSEEGKHIQRLLSWRWMGETSRFEYRNGYKQAADLLVERITGGSGHFLSTFGLAYPTLFLYRHYVEIECKDMLALATMLGLVTPPERPSHDLSWLREQVLVCAEPVYGDVAKDEFDERGFDELFALLHSLDPYGDSFRFPLRRDGTAQWDDTNFVDVLDIKDTVDAFSRWCHEFREELRQMIDPKAENMGDRSYFY